MHMRRRSNPYIPLNKKINDAHEMIVVLKDNLETLKGDIGLSTVEKKDLKTLQKMSKLCGQLYTLANKL